MKSARGMPQNVQTRWLCSPFFYWPSNFFWRANKALKPKLRNRPSVIIFDICQLLTEKQTKKSKSAYVSSCIECIWSKKLKGFAAIKGFCVFCVFYFHSPMLSRTLKCRPKNRYQKAGWKCSCLWEHLFFKG